MFVEIFVAIILGILAGVVSGLIPGIHINLISTFLLSLSAYLLGFADPLTLAVFIISMSVTHTFLDAIPSIFLGAPDADTAMGVLPGHKMLLDGKGYAAVLLTVVGSYGALLLSVALVPLLMVIVAFIYPMIKDYIGYFLILIMAFMILKERKKLWAIFLFLLAGSFGAVVLNIPNLRNPLFAMLSGIFGVSTLVLSLKDSTKIPEQIFDDEKIDKKVAAQAIGSSTFAGMLTSFFPGLGPAQGCVIAQQLTRNIGDKGFLILVGGVNTVNMVMSLVTLYVLNKARNGSVIAISELMQIDMNGLIVLFCSSLIVGTVCIYLALFIAKRFGLIITKVNYKMMVGSVIGLIVVLSVVLSGMLGLFILVIATIIGMIAPLKNISRSHAMGCLILPVIVYFVV